MSNKMQENFEFILASVPTGSGTASTAASAANPFGIENPRGCHTQVKIYLISAAGIILAVLQLIIIRVLEVDMEGKIPIPTIFWYLFAAVFVTIVLCTDAIYVLSLNLLLLFLIIETAMLMVATNRWVKLSLIEMGYVLMITVLIHLILYSFGAFSPLKYLPKTSYIIILVCISVFAICAAHFTVYMSRNVYWKIYVEFGTIVCFSALMIYLSTKIHQRHLEEIDDLYMICVVLVIMFFLTFLSSLSPITLYFLRTDKTQCCTSIFA